MEAGSFFGSFMPHGMCYVWRPDILGLHVASDALTSLAYLSIPFVMFRFLKNRVDIPFRNVVYMFCVFIFACGLTHLMAVWIVWNGHYGVQGILKAITALASVVTAIMLYPVFPKLLALRSPQELEQSNNALQTEIVNRQQQEMQNYTLLEELAHMGRVSTMGEMATGLAHELNQPLMAISQNTDTAMVVAKQNDANDPVLMECLADIEYETQRAGEIIRALRQLVAKEKTSRSEVEIDALVEQVVRLVRNEERANEIEVDVSTNTQSSLLLNRVQIAQVLVNLVRNSMQAISSESRRGKVLVTTKCSGDDIVVSVEDTGPGIASMANLFKPFESSKPHGLGMGLSISRSIIESHGGVISAANRKEGGACFVFSLPNKKIMVD